MKDKKEKRGREYPDNLFDKEQLKIGTKHELEHTDDTEEAKRIAKDHIWEHKDYYKKLPKCEAKMKKSSDFIKEAFNDLFKAFGKRGGQVTGFQGKRAQYESQAKDPAKSVTYSKMKEKMDEAKGIEKKEKKPKKETSMYSTSSEIISKALDILKGKGEGSRGGKVIGHTKSGKPIYETKHPGLYGDFNAKDHADAAEAHGKAAAKHEELEKKFGVMHPLSTTHSMKKLDNLEQAEVHKHYKNKKSEQAKKVKEEWGKHSPDPKRRDWSNLGGKLVNKRMGTEMKASPKGEGLGTTKNTPKKKKVDISVKADPKVVKGMETRLKEKSELGQTLSGKPIHFASNAKDDAFSKYSVSDHMSAYKRHLDLYKKYKAEWTKADKGGKKGAHIDDLYNRALYHLSMQFQHRDLATHGVINNDDVDDSKVYHRRIKRYSEHKKSNKE